MLSLALYGLLAVVVIAVLYVITVRFLPAGEQIAPSVRDELPWALPDDRRLQAGDVAVVRLPVALRGYRFAETDQLLDRVTEELRARDDEIARLRTGAASVADYDAASAAGPEPVSPEPASPEPAGPESGDRAE